MTKPVFTEQTPLPARPEPDFRRWIIIHRMPFWIYFRIPRPYKEMAKEVLFSLFPVIFSRRPEFSNWKNARSFKGKEDRFFRLSFWKKVWNNGEELLHLSPDQTGPATGKMQKLAIVIHAFYPEILTEILQHIGTGHPNELQLFVTCPPSSEEEVGQILSGQTLPYALHVFENKGRDVLPFLKVIPEIKNQGFEIVLKVHTKKSSHHINNAGWKKDIFDKLLSPDKILRFTQILSSTPGIGIIGPENHILPMSMYYSNNTDNVFSLCVRMGIDTAEYSQIHFVAGTMFYAHISAFQPILDLRLCDDDFESEEGQVDGTMAHAVERAFGAACLKEKLWILDTRSTTKQLRSKSVMNYHFSI